MFNEELKRFVTYWMERIPNVSFKGIIFSCLEKKAYGTQPGHVQFYYPKYYGDGELWLRIADAL